MMHASTSRGYPAATAESRFWNARVAARRRRTPSAACASYPLVNEFTATECRAHAPARSATDMTRRRRDACIDVIQSEVHGHDNHAGAAGLEQGAGITAEIGRKM